MKSLFLAQTLLLSVSLPALAVADATAYIVDCVQGTSIASQLSMFENDSGFDQNQPDWCVPITPISGTVSQYDQTQYDLNGDESAKVKVHITLENVNVYDSSGSLIFNDIEHWNCFRDDGRMLFPSFRAPTAQMPFAQCFTRHYCKKAPHAGSVKIQLVMGTVCGGGLQDTSAVHGFGGPKRGPASNGDSNAENSEGQGLKGNSNSENGDGSPGAITKAKRQDGIQLDCEAEDSMFVAIYDLAGNTLCWTSMAAGDTYAKVVDGYYEGCGMNVTVHDMNYKDVHMSADITAWDGVTVLCGIQQASFATDFVVLGSVDRYTYGCSWN